MKTRPHIIDDIKKANDIGLAALKVREGLARRETEGTVFCHSDGSAAATFRRDCEGARLLTIHLFNAHGCLFGRRARIIGQQNARERPVLPNFVEVIDIDCGPGRYFQCWQARRKRRGQRGSSQDSAGPVEPAERHDRGRAWRCEDFGRTPRACLQPLHKDPRGLFISRCLRTRPEQMCLSADGLQLKRLNGNVADNEARRRPLHPIPG